MTQANGQAPRAAKLVFSLLSLLWLATSSQALPQDPQSVAAPAASNTSCEDGLWKEFNTTGESWNKEGWSNVSTAVQFNQWIINYGNKPIGDMIRSLAQPGGACENGLCKREESKRQSSEIAQEKVYGDLANSEDTPSLRKYLMKIRVIDFSLPRDGSGPKLALDFIEIMAQALQEAQQTVARKGVIQSFGPNFLIVQHEHHGYHMSLTIANEVDGAGLKKLDNAGLEAPNGGTCTGHLAPDQLAHIRNSISCNAFQGQTTMAKGYGMLDALCSTRVSPFESWSDNYQSTGMILKP